MTGRDAILALEAEVDRLRDLVAFYEQFAPPAEDALPVSRRAEIRARIRAAVAIVDAGYETPCWLWQLADSGDGRGGGYPRMKLNSRTVAAHIVSFVNEFGYVPRNKQIDHKCRQRRCVNPDHLEMVSHVENAKRRDAANGVQRRPKRKRRASS